MQFELSDEQNQHINRLTDEFVSRAFHKYSAGAEEHKGNLWEKDELWLIDQAIDEAIDQFVYLVTLKEKIAERNGSK